MTLKELLYSIHAEDINKVILWVDDKGGWSNVKVEVTESSINIKPDFEILFDE